MNTLLITATLTLCVGTIGANSLALGPISPGIAGDFGTGVTTVMYATASYGLGTATGALTLSPLIGRFGVQKALSMALAGLCAAFLMTTISTGVVMLVIAQGAAGLAAGLGLPAAYAFATQIAEPRHESRTLGWVLTGWTLSLGVGVTLSAIVADIAHWRWVYGGLTILMLFTFAALTQAKSPKVMDDHNSPAWPHQMLGMPGVLPLLGLNLIVASLSAIDPTRVGAIVGLNSAVTYTSASVGTLVFGYINSHTGFVPVAGGSAVIVLAATGLAFMRSGDRRAFRTS